MQEVGLPAVCRLDLMENMLMMHNVTDKSPMQEPLLSACLTLVQAMLFGRPDPYAKVGYSLMHTPHTATPVMVQLMSRKFTCVKTHCTS